jgi:glucokinase
VEPHEVMYVDHFEREYPFFLAGDIGGTNSNFGLFSLVPERPVLVLSLHYKSKEISDFTQFMKEVVDYLASQYDLTFDSACLGAAGIVFPHRVSARPTNLSLEINTNQIKKVTGLKDLFLINDFEAVALGIELLAPKSIVPLNQDAKYHKHANRAFIGAGTGLGKGMLLWHRDAKRYLPLASEGGHADAVFHSEKEFALGRFIHDTYVKCPVSWEMVLSGAGIQKIYHFLGTLNAYPETQYSREIAEKDFDPDRISFYADHDPKSKDTFDMYRTFYARACKNFVLEALALDGIYIAGGIAAKNRGLFFDPLFMEEFVKCGKQSKQLQEIPVLLITDYNVSLYGAVVAAQLRKKGEL